MKTIAAILAGGSGKRLGGNLPKQYLTLRGKLVIEHTVEAFQQNPSVDGIIIVVHPDYVTFVRGLVEANDWIKVHQVVEGGKERSDSSLAAIAACQNQYGEATDINLLIHDAARPLVSQRIITDVISALDCHKAVNVAVPSRDTILECDADYITHIPERSRFMLAQTPQGFRLSTIRQAFLLALQDPCFSVTDDCGVVSRYLPEERIYIVQGDYSNMKITFPTDLPLIESLMQ